MKLFKSILISFLCISSIASAQILDPLVDHRYGGVVVRNTDGSIARSSKVYTAFRKIWVCPVTKLHTGACPGWSVDHVIPLACGGKDVVYNMSWMPNAGKSCSQDYCKDRYERKIYGGNNMSPGCP